MSSICLGLVLGILDTEEEVGTGEKILAEDEEGILAYEAVCDMDGLDSDPTLGSNAAPRTDG